jgi:hypothetical protein
MATRRVRFSRRAGVLTELAHGAADAMVVLLTRTGESPSLLRPARDTVKVGDRFGRKLQLRGL